MQTVATLSQPQLTSLVDAADRLGAGCSDAEDPVRHTHLIITAASIVEVTGRTAVGATSERVNVTDSVALNVWTILHHTVVCREKYLASKSIL